MKYVLKYTPIESGEDAYWLATHNLQEAILLDTIEIAIHEGVEHRDYFENGYNEAVIMAVEVEDDTVFPSKDVRDQPLPPK